jgi:stage III sporulation protein AD
MAFDTLKLCGVAIIGAAGAMIMRELRRELEIPVRLTVMLMLVTFAVIMSEPVVKYAAELLGASQISGEAASIILRALGIALITKLGADICRDMGTPSVASALELAGKIEIIVLSLPLISSALDTLGKLMNSAGI